MGTNKKSSSRKGCLMAVLIVLSSFSAALLIGNWGFWRSKAYELTGAEFPLKTLYRTDTSGRGRDAGFFIVVYQLPSDIKAVLEKNKINLSDYPMFCAGLELDHYKRINWTKTFQRNEVEKYLYNSFWNSGPEKMPDIKKITDDTGAECLAGFLFKQPETMYGGWYKGNKQFGELVISDYFFYVINLEKQILIMFGLNT